jgi:hypothetical protein
MCIVSQSTSVSYSLFPPFPLLPAPAPRRLLTAPKVAGLLPARVAAPFDSVTDSVLLRDDPTPPPFVSKDRAKLPPEVLHLIGHLPAPDELQHRHETRMRAINEKWEARRRLLLENRDEFIRMLREGTLQ